MTLAIILLLSMTAAPTTIPLPGGSGGIGFDDLLYSPALDRVLVPAGRSGRLDLIDPGTGAVQSISGFSAESHFGGGHGQGTTSADSGAGLIFASDRSLRQVVLLDAKRHVRLGSVRLKAGPDYVRWVAPVNEVWVTEPRAQAIEVFKLVLTPKPHLERMLDIPVPDGPESLVIDPARSRAYTHSWKALTYAVDLESHQVAERWPNGCEGSRGIALDAARGYLFVGCDEGKAVTLDAAHGGKVLGTASSGKGVDIIAYDAGLQHLYLPGGDSATMAVLQVNPDGTVKVLRTVPTAPDAHCVASDQRGHALVCDPQRGRLLRFDDVP